MGRIHPVEQDWTIMRRVSRTRGIRRKAFEEGWLHGKRGVEIRPPLPRRFQGACHSLSLWFPRLAVTIVSFAVFSRLPPLLGSSIRLIIRTELRSAGSWINNDQIYDTIVTSHAFLIIFFIVIPFLIGGFGNWLISLILGSQI